MHDTDPILDFYDNGREIERLKTPFGNLELSRTRTLLERYIPPVPQVIFDIGGAQGVYAFWLAAQGHQVHLLDLSPLHIEEARRCALQEGVPQLQGLLVADARALPQADASADVVLLGGPLYHLIHATDRLQTLREAWRVLKPGGLLLATAISQYASTMVGIQREWLWDTDYFGMMEAEVQRSEHRRPASWPNLFVDGCFHSPALLRQEAEQAGFAVSALLGIQGPGWLVPGFEAHWQDPQRRHTLLELAQLTEHDPVLSPHFLLVAHKPQR